MNGSVSSGVFNKKDLDFVAAEVISLDEVNFGEVFTVQHRVVLLSEDEEHRWRLISLLNHFKEQLPQL